MVNNSTKLDEDTQKLIDELEREVKAALEEASKEAKEPTNFFNQEENRK